MTGFESNGGKIVIFDGGMGSLLQENGLQPGERPELWNLTHPQVVEGIHLAYLEAGADLITANTFGANSLNYGQEGPQSLRKVIEEGLALARRARQESGRENVRIALDVGPSGKMLKPLGDLDFEDAVGIFAETIRIGTECGADLIMIETMSDAYEAKAALLAAREQTDLPVFVSMTFGEDCRLLTGMDPEGAAALLEGLGADAIGVNCGTGPETMRRAADRLIAASSLPVFVMPNAGLPRTENGKTVYDVSPAKFAAAVRKIAEDGARMVGGCCGTIPEHIRMLKNACSGLEARPVVPKHRTVITSGAQTLVFSERPVIIGERINPTGKKRFKEALKKRDINYILQEGLRQEACGAHVLDVNVGLPGIDEAEMMTAAVTELQGVTMLPLQIDTSDIGAMERALRRYNGKAMVNSVSGKKESMEAVFPLVRKYGGVAVALLLDESGIPQTADGRLAVAEKILQTAASYGIRKEDIVADALAMTISSEPGAAKVTLETVRRLKTELGLNSILGISNVSFGLPQRENINAAFFTMAMQNGLSAAIINPLSEPMMKAWRVYCAIAGLDAQCMDYISWCSEHPEEKEKTAVKPPAGTVMQTAGAQDAVQGMTPEEEKGKAGAPGKNPGQEPQTALPPQNGPSATEQDSGKEEGLLSAAIRRGLKEEAARVTARLLAVKEPLEIINSCLVPALDEVGKGFERGKVFLPQLLMSADAAKSAFDVIRDTIQKSGKPREEKGVIVLATVKGDIHDIGKNIVKVLLENYGYRVADLGKDVPPERVVEEARRVGAGMIGLSALMTTTVGAMEETIRLVHRELPGVPVLVGGAVLTESYAREIHADAYAKDAMASVRFAETFFSKQSG